MQIETERIIIQTSRLDLAEAIVVVTHLHNFKKKDRKKQEGKLAEIFKK